MAILGHPLYAGGRYQDGEEAAGEWSGPKDIGAFAAIHRLLKEHQVDVVMAGDTHYFEHYVEKYAAADGPRTMLHFVNGGGGAYMSIGTPLDWPKKPALPDCAFFPRTDAVISKLDKATPSLEDAVVALGEESAPGRSAPKQLPERLITAAPRSFRVLSKFEWRARPTGSA